MKKIIIPEITKEFEKFDIDIFNKQVDSISGKRIITTKEKYLEERQYSKGYIRLELLNNSYFKTVKKFNKQGIISEKAILFINGYPIENRYIFDEEGKLIKEINTDKGYDFDWEKVIKYCEDKKIELTKGFPKGGFNTSIYKEEENGKKVWVISYLLPVGDKIMELTLDGKTGEKIKQRELDFIGG